MKADVAMTASPPTAVAPGAFAARVLAQVTNWYANEHGQLTVRLSRDGQGVTS